MAESGHLIVDSGNSSSARNSKSSSGKDKKKLDDIENKAIYIYYTKRYWKMLGREY